MKKNFLIILILALLLNLNCAKTGDSSTAVPDYISLDSASAQTMVDSVVTNCGLSGAGTAMGAAPATINDGTSVTPVNNSYTLSGGATTITGVIGNIWITGTGTVTISGTFIGNIQICGPSVDIINLDSSSSTNIYIKDGDLDSVSSLFGNIAIKNGQPNGTISGLNGNIAWEYNGTTQGRTYSTR